MTKHKRTQEDWIKIGNNVKDVYYELLEAYMDLSHRLGKSNNNVQKIGKAVALVDQARCDLESEMFRENPNLSDDWLNLFYGHTFNLTPDSDEVLKTRIHLESGSYVDVREPYETVKDLLTHTPEYWVHFTLEDGSPVSFQRNWIAYVTKF